MLNDILFETSLWHSRAAVFNPQGELISVRVEDVTRPYIEGAVVYGRVQSIQKGLQAAFVDIGDPQPGFLPLQTLEGQKITEGQAVLVRVTRACDLEKGARLDGRVPMTPPAIPEKIPSLVLPAASALRRAIMECGDTPARCWVLNAEAAEIAADVFPQERIYVLDEHPDVDLVEQLDDQLDMAFGTEFPLPNGKLTIERTKALVAIDVDAHDLLGGMNRAENILTFNCMAAAQVVRLCKLLDLGGNIIVDFIGLPKPWQRKKVVEHMQNLFALQDMNKVTVNPMSRHGLVEINRERLGAMLPELLQYPPFVAGRVILDLLRHKPRVGTEPLQIKAHPAVIAVLKDRLTGDVCQRLLGRPAQFDALENAHVTVVKVSG